MNRIYRDIILSKEFIEESRKLFPDQSAQHLRDAMIVALNTQAAKLGIVPDGDDLALQSKFIAGRLDRPEIASRMKSQLVGRLGRKR